MFFRTLGQWEGMSLIVLLFLAMPLKYFFGLPIAVKIVGSIHGLLFTLYLIFGVIHAKKANWKITKLLFAYIVSVIPFGFIIFDKKLFTQN